MSTPASPEHSGSNLWLVRGLACASAGVLLAMTLIPLVHLNCMRGSTPPAQAARQGPGWDWLDVKFSPRGHTLDQLLKAVKQCQRSLRVQAYSFTQKEFALALGQARQRGLEVQIILDASNLKDRHSQGGFCARAGIDVHVDDRHAIAHNKIVILDDEAVLTGSYNFSQAAENSNAENQVPVRDPDLVRKYLDNFKAHRAHSRLLSPDGTVGEVGGD